MVKWRILLEKLVIGHLTIFAFIDFVKELVEGHIRHGEQTILKYSAENSPGMDDVYQ